MQKNFSGLSGLGEEHQTTLIDYSNLAQMYMEQNEFSKAENFYEKCIKIQEKINGIVHPDTIRYCENLAIINVKNKHDYKKAEKLFEKSLRIQEKLSGDKHPSIATMYDNLAYAYELQKKYAEAEKLYKKGIGILKEVGGENHTDIARIYSNLAVMYKQKGEYQQMLLSDLEVYKIWLWKFGLNHEKTQKSYKMLKNTYSKYNPEGDFEQWLEERMKE